MDAASTSSGKPVFFYGGRFRRARCGICGGLVAGQAAIRQHAEFHVLLGHHVLLGYVKTEPLYDPWCEVTVYDDHSVMSGWVTNQTGPG